MKVDSETKVENLNAAKVDGKGPEEFMPSQRYVTSGLLDSGTSTPNGEWVSVDVVCDFEDVLLSGGVHLNDPQEDRIAESWPKDPLLGGWEWTGGMIDNGGHDYGSVWALCADYPPLRQ